MLALGQGSQLLSTWVPQDTAASSCRARDPRDQDRDQASEVTNCQISQEGPALIQWRRGLHRNMKTRSHPGMWFPGSLRHWPLSAMGWSRWPDARPPPPPATFQSGQNFWGLSASQEQPPSVTDGPRCTQGPDPSGLEWEPSVNYAPVAPWQLA